MVDVNADVRVDVAESLPAPTADGAQSKIRGGKYDEQYVIPILRKTHALALEGSYYITHNNQTGIATGTSVAFSATAPFLILYNGNTTLNKNWLVDYINLVTTTSPGGASGCTNLQIVGVLDAGNRYASGGSQISANFVNPHGGKGNTPQGAVYCGNLTATATNNPRTVIPIRVLRPAVSGTVFDVVGEEKYLNFGAQETMQSGAITVASANMISKPLPPIIIPPLQSFLLYLILNGAATPTAGNYAPEIGIIER